MALCARIHYFDSNKKEHYQSVSKKDYLISNLYGISGASICVKGPWYVTAQDIILPPSVQIVDNTQHIANLMEPINLYIELQIERDRRYRILIFLLTDSFEKKKKELANSKQLIKKKKSIFIYFYGIYISIFMVHTFHSSSNSYVIRSGTPTFPDGVFIFARNPCYFLFYPYMFNNSMSLGFCC